MWLSGPAVREGFVPLEDGTRLFYRRLGEAGEAIVFPNGFHLLDDFAWLAQRHTLIAYDLRHRGRSEGPPPGPEARGILDDVADLFWVRRHLGLHRFHLLAHSYVSVLAALFAVKYPAWLQRVILLGPPPPEAGKQYEPALAHSDHVLAEAMAHLAELSRTRALEDPQAYCERVWSILQPIYVADPKLANRIHWGRCELANERSFMDYWSRVLYPSLQALHFSPADLARAALPFLVIHGRLDRSSPYGAGRDWAARLPEARLLTVDNAAHAPWIEAPGVVCDAIGTFLDGRWPPGAEAVA